MCAWTSDLVTSLTTQKKKFFDSSNRIEFIDHILFKPETAIHFISVFQIIFLPFAFVNKSFATIIRIIVQASASSKRCSTPAGNPIWALPVRWYIQPSYTYGIGRSEASKATAKHQSLGAGSIPLDSYYVVIAYYQTKKKGKPNAPSKHYTNNMICFSFLTNQVSNESSKDYQPKRNKALQTGRGSESWVTVHGLILFQNVYFIWQKNRNHMGIGFCYVCIWCLHHHFDLKRTAFCTVVLNNWVNNLPHTTDHIWMI